MSGPNASALTSMHCRGQKPSIAKDDVDVILCSDCIYDEDLVEVLAKTIAALSRPDTGAFCSCLPR